MLLIKNNVIMQPFLVAFYKTRKSVTSGQMIDMVWERSYISTSLLFCENNYERSEIKYWKIFYLKT